MRPRLPSAIALAAALLLAAAAPARAEDLAVYETEGEADAAGSEPRVAALDDAFARAVSQALSDLLDDGVRRANRAALAEHVIGRARLWVARFAVRRDETADGRRQLTVTVRIDRDKLRARLAELGIEADAPAAEAGPAGARTAVVLLRVADARGARASFGAAAEREPPGYGALAGALRAGGLAVKRAPAAGPAARADGDLPLDDGAAAALAAEAKAELAAVAGVAIGEPVPVRGQPGAAVLVTAHVRALAGDRLVGQGTAAAAARGAEGPVVAAAVDRALVAAAADALPPARAQLGRGAGYSGDDTPVAEPGVVLVRLAPRTPWGLVAAELKWLAGAKGVRRAVLRRASPSGWVIGVTTSEPVEKIAQIARRSPASGASAKVRIANGIVEVALTGAP